MYTNSGKNKYLLQLLEYSVANYWHSSQYFKNLLLYPVFSYIHTVVPPAGCITCITEPCGCRQPLSLAVLAAWTWVAVLHRHAIGHIAVRAFGTWVLVIVLCAIQAVITIRTREV